MFKKFDLNNVVIINDGSLFRMAENARSKINSLYDNNLHDILKKLSKEELYLSALFAEYTENKIILQPNVYEDIILNFFKKRTHMSDKESQETYFENLFQPCNFIDKPINLKKDLLDIKELEIEFGSDDLKFIILTSDESIIDDNNFFSISTFCDFLEGNTDFMKLIKSSKYYIEPNL